MHCLPEPIKSSSFISLLRQRKRPGKVARPDGSGVSSSRAIASAGKALSWGPDQASGGRCQSRQPESARHCRHGPRPPHGPQSAPPAGPTCAGCARCPACAPYLLALRGGDQRCAGCRSAVPLLALPAELLAAVAAHLPVAAIWLLRLTCRGLRSAVARPAGPLDRAETHAYYRALRAWVSPRLHYCPECVIYHTWTRADYYEDVTFADDVDGPANGRVGVAAEGTPGYREPQVWCRRHWARTVGHRTFWGRRACRVCLRLCNSENCCRLCSVCAVCNWRAPGRYFGATCSVCTEAEDYLAMGGL